MAFNDGVTAPVVGGDGTIFFGGRDKTLYALAPSGEVAWKEKLDGRVMSPVALAPSGMLYVAPHWRDDVGVQTTLFAVDPSAAAKARICWTAAIRGHVRALTVDREGGLLATTSQGVLHRFDEDGRPSFSTQVGEHDADGVTVLARGLLVVRASQAGKYCIVGVRADGTIAFHHPVGASGPSVAALDDGSFSFLESGGRFHRWSAEGQALGNYAGTPDANVIGGMAVAGDGSIRVPNSHRTRGSLDAFGGDGVATWHFDHPAGFGAQPLMFDGGSLLASALDGSVLAVSAAGALEWSLTIGAPAHPNAWVSPSAIVPTPNGAFIARWDAPLDPRKDSAREPCEIVCLG
jgi:outer membrane protein assembly factor BamB